MKKLIGLRKALGLTFSNIETTGTETVPLAQLGGRVLAVDVYAGVDSPSVNASLKDGYAVRSEDVKAADKGNPVVLEVVGNAAAGAIKDLSVSAGTTIRITTGAGLPQGADAVVSEEYVSRQGETIRCYKTAGAGRNVLFKGTDIAKGEIVAKAWEKVTPPLSGLMATAGLDRAEVYKNPRVCLLATGDEVVAPGKPLPEGKLYASNITAISCWLAQYQIDCRVVFARDRKEDMVSAIRRQMTEADAFISSGGIWGSEKDLMIEILERLGWRGIYHRVRMGPGKSVAFGLLGDKPFFCLPGGPPSNEMAFFQIALPGLLRMKGEMRLPFTTIPARLTETVKGDPEWTRFVHGQVARENGAFCVTPLKQKSRLQSMATKDALICKPEGCGRLESGETAEIQLLDPSVLHQP